MTTAPPQTPPPAGLPIDPRIRERRIAVRRAEGRRRLKFLCAMSALMLVGVLAVGITHSTLLAVHHVEVSGIAHTSRSEVLAAAGLQPGALMFHVHPEQMARRLATLPWVDSAAVSQHWPDSVRIHIRERQAVAVVASGTGHAALIDVTGRVLALAPGTPANPANPANPAAGAAAATPATSASSATSARPAGSATATSTGATSRPVTAGPRRAAPLPTIRGLDPAGPPGTTLAGSQDALDALALVAAIDRGLVPAVAARVVAIAVAADGQLTAALTPSVTVRFGPPDGLDDKVVALGTLLDRADIKGISTIDVRVPDAPVLTRPGGASTVSTTPRG